MKKILIFSIILILSLSFALPIAKAQEKPVELNLFYSETCPHCHKERDFLDKTIKPKYPDLIINEFVLSDQANVDKLVEFYQQYQVPQEYFGAEQSSYIDDKYFLGYTEKTSQTIESNIIILLSQIDNSKLSSSEVIGSAQNPGQPSEQHGQPVEERDSIKIPIIGEVNLKNASPLTMSIVFGALDGFNACAMVALGFLLAVLIGTGIRKKVVLIGGTFIFVSGLVYFIFIAAWLNLFLIVEHMQIITIAVAIIVGLFAIFMIKDYAHGVVCKICQIKPGEKSSIFQRAEKFLFIKMDYLTKAEISTPLLLLGVSIVAVGINTVELICSFGFPLAFTKALTSMGLSSLSYYFYLIIYVIFYMIDDFIIFLIAVFTLRVTGVSDKYLKFIKLISGVLLLIMAIILLFKPSLLTFNL